MDKLFRSVPYFKGKARLARVLLSGIKTKTDVLVAGRYNCQYLLPNITESIGFDVFINGEYEPDIQQLIYQLLPANGCFLDLGGNIGAIVVPAAKRRPDIKAISVEAAPWIFKYLESNVQRNSIQNVKLINTALFDKDDIELDFFSPHDNFGKGSLSPVFTKQAIKVKTKTVDTIIKELGFPKIDLLKIDIEGFEYFAFKGAANLLSGPDAPVLVFEFVDWAETQAMNLAAGSAQRLLIEYGYTLYKIGADKLTKLEAPMTGGASNLVASKRELSPALFKSGGI